MLKYKIPQIVTLILNPSGFYVDPKLTRSFCAKKTKILYKYLVEDLCDRDRIQTCNRLIRSQLLYSVELRGHCKTNRTSFGSDRDRIQTCNRLIRSQLLYSVELRGLVCFTGAKIRTFFELARDTQTFFEKNYSINR